MLTREQFELSRGGPPVEPSDDSFILAVANAMMGFAGLAFAVVVLVYSFGCIS